MHVSNVQLLKKVSVGKYLPDVEQPGVIITDAEATEFTATDGYDYIKLTHVTVSSGQDVNQFVGTRMKLKCGSPSFEIEDIEVATVDNSDKEGLIVNIKVVN